MAVGAEVLHDESQFGAVEHVHHLVDAGVDGAAQEVGVKQRFDFERHVAENHGQGKRFELPRAGCRLVPLALGVIHLGKHDVESAAGYVLILLVARGDGQLPEGDDGEGVGEDVVRLHERPSLAVEGEIPVELPVVAVPLQELGTLDGTVEPLLPFLHLVVERGEHPHFAALHPDEFVGVEHLARTVKAGEVAAELLVLRLL